MKLNLPNKLTVVRLCLVPVILVAVLFFTDAAKFGVWGRLAATLVFIIASLTDFIDGKIARKYNMITDFGKFLDPLADKFMVMAALLSMVCIEGYTTYGILLFITSVIIVFRELAVTSMRLVVASSKDKIVIAASWLGKIKTATQVAFIVAALLEPVFWDKRIISYILMAPTAVMTVWSGASYIVGYWKYLDPSK